MVFHWKLGYQHRSSVWKNFISLIVNNLRKLSTLCGKLKHEISSTGFTFVLINRIHEIITIVQSLAIKKGGQLAIRKEGIPSS